jgi:hypothetical protein
MANTTPDLPDVPPLPEETERRIPNVAIWAGVGALVLGLVGGFFLGRGNASSGPSSLAAAIAQTESGSLPRGDVTGALQGGGGVRALLGGSGGGGFGVGAGGRTGAGGTGGTGTGGGTGAGGGTGGRGLGSGVAGTVSSVNGNVITITSPAGPVQVIVSGSTTYSKSAAASISDVTAGERVTVRPDFTVPSSGGKVNAGSVVIIPAGTTTPGATAGA